MEQVLKVNKKQLEFLMTVLENKADYLNKHGFGYNSGFRATFQAGRGTGKTNLIMRLLAECSFELPRGKFGIASLTYAHVQNVVLSQCRKVWEEYGLYEYDAKVRPWGHYVVNRRPPADWDKPLEGVEKYDNVITFCNGFSLVMLSADTPEFARGLNLDGLMMDESFLLTEQFYNAVLRKTVRANKYAFRDPRPERKGLNHPLHWLICDFTSGAWTPEQQWIYRTEDLMKEDPTKYYFLTANAYDNLENLPGDYIENERQSATSDIAFRIEVLNERVSLKGNNFYPTFSRATHTYFKAYDYRFNPNTYLTEYTRIDYSLDKTLDIGFDFNAKFTSMLIAQDHSDENQYRFVDALHVKQSNDFTIIEQIAYDFCKKYANHRNKKVSVYGDRSGNRQDAGMKKTYYETIFDILRKEGWRVTNRVQSTYPPYSTRYQVINSILAGDNYTGPSITFNQETCMDAIISIENAPIFQDNFEKDKRSEKNEKIDQRFATHFSDIFDYMIFAKFKRFTNSSRRSAVMPVSR